MKAWLRNIAYHIAKPILVSRHTRSVPFLNNFSKRFEEEKICRVISPGLFVKAGPFQGMKYAIAEAAGSVLIPKIAGTYEDELHESIELLCQNRYDTIVDIGSAEGYYAIGFAMKIPSATAYAYDNDPYANYLCRKNAAVNNLGNRLRIRTAMEPGELASFQFKIRGLIICDCEGYEKTLFTVYTVTNLLNVDLLIELHDCDDPSISKTILPLFEGTHQLKLINSVPNKSARNYPSLANLPVTDEMLNERGNTPMQWAVLISLQK